jgi:hypothetical protein
MLKVIEGGRHPSPCLTEQEYDFVVGFYFFLISLGICTQCSTVMRMREVTEGGRPPSPYLEEQEYEFSLATSGQKLAVGENVCTYVYVYIFVYTYIQICLGIYILE